MVVILGHTLNDSLDEHLGPRVLAAQNDVGSCLASLQSSEIRVASSLSEGQVKTSLQNILLYLKFSTASHVSLSRSQGERFHFRGKKLEQ